MDRYAVLGAKKLLSLTRTKIRLAEEAATSECRPAPLPLVKKLSGKDIMDVSQAKRHREDLAGCLDCSDEKSMAATVLQCMDIIEGVKYKYEPPEYVCNIDAEGMRSIEERAKKASLPVNILLMTETAPEGINLFIGENPPQGTIFLSGVPTSLVPFLAYAFSSDHFSEDGRLKNLVSYIGHRTLIINAIHCSLLVFGAREGSME